MATRKPAKRKSSSGGSSIGLILVVALLAAAAGAGVMYLANQKHAGKAQETETREPEAKAGKDSKAKATDKAGKDSARDNKDAGKDSKATKADAEAEKPKAAADSPDYTFYTVLPQNEVRVPDQPANATAKPGPANPSEVYVLQVGSFRQAAEADRRRAELILLGLDVMVEKVTVSSGETWHRVLVGPFNALDKATKAKETLAANKVDSMLLKRQPGT